MPDAKPKISGEKPRSWFIDRAAKEMFTRSRKLATYIAAMNGISRQAARVRMRSAAMRSVALSMA